MLRKLFILLPFLGSLFFANSAFAASIVGYWDFEETSGDTVFDQSSFNNDGTLTGATRSAGKVGRGLSFDGSGGVTIPHSPSLDSFPDGFTLEAWIRPTAFPLSNSDYGTIFFKTDRDNRQHMLHFQVGAGVPGKLYTAMNGTPEAGGPPNYEGIADPTIGLNEWHFVAWTFDNFFHRIYDNGYEIFNEAYTEPWAGNLEDLQIGQHRQLPLNANFYGFIDEARIYSGALSRQEILDDMNSLNRVIPEPSSLILLLTGLAAFLIRARRPIHY